eukprot:UN27289
MQALLTRLPRRKFSTVNPALDRLVDLCKKSPKRHIILPEGQDIRCIKAASMALERDIANISLMGDENTIYKQAKENNISLDGIKIFEPSKDSHFDEVVDSFADLRSRKGVSKDSAKIFCADNQIYGNMLVRLGHGDGTVAGSLSPTSTVIKHALWCLGVQKGLECASSFF